MEVTVTRQRKDWHCKFRHCSKACKEIYSRNVTGQIDHTGTEKQGRLVRFWTVYHASALDECRHQGNNGGSSSGPRHLVLEQHSRDDSAHHATFPPTCSTISGILELEESSFQTRKAK
uniref:Uncharacterized protein n=1 Tax=Aegilops tauschii TaxID=37682 RepID=M8BXF5_AEGTA